MIKRRFVRLAAFALFAVIAVDFCIRLQRAHTALELDKEQNSATAKRETKPKRVGSYATAAIISTQSEYITHESPTEVSRGSLLDRYPNHATREPLWPEINTNNPPCASIKSTSRIAILAGEEFAAKIGVRRCIVLVWRDDLLMRLELRQQADWVEKASQNFAELDSNTIYLLSTNHRKAYKLLSGAAKRKDAKAAWLTSEYASKFKLEENWSGKLGYEPVPAVAIFHDAYLTEYGELATRRCTLKVKSCKPRMTTYAAPSTDSTVYDTVAVIAAPYYSQSQDYFHFMCERLVRVALLLDLLRSKPAIKVQVGHLKSYVTAAFALLGVNRSRLVTGKLYAKVAYFPEPVACGNPPFALLQFTRNMLLEALWPAHHFNTGPNASAPRPPRPIMVVIRRLKSSFGGRNIDNFEELLKYVKTAYWKHQIQVHTGEEPWVEQLKLFSQASVVIAPHGAGLSNTMVCAPGTVVLEFQPPHDVNMCFMTIAAKLGHRYASIVAEPHKRAENEPLASRGHMHVPVAKMAATLAKVLPVPT